MSSTPSNSLFGESHFGRTMHLGLDDIDAARAAVALFPANVVQRHQAGYDRIHDAFADLAAIGQQDGVAGHQVADIADEQQAAARQGDFSAIGRSIVAVGIGGALHRLAAFFEAGGERAVHQPQPVAIGAGLVFGIHGGDGVFAVHDGGDGRFQHHVADACLVGLADRVIAVDMDFDVQAVMGKQDDAWRSGFAGIALELGRILQRGPECAALDRKRRHVLP